MPGLRKTLTVKHQTSNIKSVFDQTRLTYVAIFEGLIKLNDMLEFLITWVDKISSKELLLATRET